MNEEHKRDGDCTLDVNDVCAGCHAWHGDPCVCCNGRGYHEVTCQEVTN